MNQEPIAWMSPDGKVSQTEGKLFYIPLYTKPQTKKCEPICRPSACDCIKPKPLSDEEIEQCFADACTDFKLLENGKTKGIVNIIDVARAIEERHGIK